MSIRRIVGKRGAGALLVVGALLATGACAGGPPVRAAATFNVHFDGNRCPTAVSVPEDQRNCAGFFSKRSDCVKVTREAVVEFAGEPAGQAKPFAVFFQPFEPLTVREGKGSFKLDARAPEKEYVFSVVSDACPVLDPILIVTH